MPPGAVPDRWEDYKPIGKKIEGTRFIAFKCPLKEDISRNIDSKNRLDRRTLLKNIPNLGLLVDLTNTYRYYDPVEFQREGIQYIKIMVPGHDIPSKHLVDTFNCCVKAFMESNKHNDKLIGVHCTHGVNRTGYFICKYMISQMTIKPKDALDRFASARGHKVERLNYVNDLHELRERSRRERKEPDNWRKLHHQPDSKNEYGHFRADRSRSRYSSERYSYRNSRRRSESRESYRNSHKSRRDDRYSYRPPSERYRISQQRSESKESYRNSHKSRRDDDKYSYRPPSERYSYKSSQRRSKSRESYNNSHNRSDNRYSYRPPSDQPVERPEVRLRRDYKIHGSGETKFDTHHSVIRKPVKDVRNHHFHK